MRHSGHPSRQVTLLPPMAIDVKRGRPPPPEGLSPAERALWEKLVLSRRPRWFDGSETLLQSFVTTTIACQRLEDQMRRARVGTGDRFIKLSRLHRQSTLLAASLATKLRLAPSSKTDKHLPGDGDRPLPNMGYPQAAARVPDEVAAVDANGERSFERLRASLYRDGSNRQGEAPAEMRPDLPERVNSENGTVPNLDSDGRRSRE